MAKVFTGRLNIPNYTCIDTDIVGGKLAGAEPGMIVFVNNTEQWYIVRSDGVLVDYALPVEVTVSSAIDIGEITIDQPVGSSITLVPHFGIKVVPTPGTGVPLTAGSTLVQAVTVWPATVNHNNVYVGDLLVDKDTSPQIILAPTSIGISIDVPVGYNMDLNNLYVDAITINDGVNFIYYK